MKRTYQPKNRKRAKTHGFRARIKTKAGKRVLKNRKRKGRVKLTGSETMKIKKPKLKPNK